MYSVVMVFIYIGFLSFLGKGGQKIRDIQEQSGAYIKVCATKVDDGLRVEKFG